MECCSSSQPIDLFTLPQQSSCSTSGTPNVTRKRKRNPDSWKKSVAKSKRACGESYISSATGKEVAAVCQGGPCNCIKKIVTLSSLMVKGKEYLHFSGN